MANQRVLIIDSNLTFLVRLRKALEKKNWDVRAVSRPRPALNEVAQEPFDVAVVDMNMEWVDVPSFVVELRQRQADLPVVLIGHYDEDVEMMPKIQAQGYLQKPYLAKDLLPIMEQAIEKGFKHAPTPPATPPPAEIHEVPSFDALMQIARKQAYTPSPNFTVEDDATLSQLMTSLHDPQVEDEILQKVRDRRGEDVARVDALSQYIEDTQPGPALVIPDDEINPASAPYQVIDERAEALDNALQTQQATLGADLADSILADPTPPQGTPTETLPITAALRLTSNDQAMHKFLSKVDDWVNRTGKIHVRPLPSWAIPPTAEELAYQEQLLAAINLTPLTDETALEFDPPPHLEQTQPISLPEIDLYLDDIDTPISPMAAVDVTFAPAYEGLDVAQIVGDMTQDVSDIPLPDYSQPVDISALIAQEIEAVSLEDVTQALGIVDEDWLDSDEHTLAGDEGATVFQTVMHPAFEPLVRTPDEEAVEALLEEMRVVGHATLQLIALSVESTARAIILGYQNRVIARTGEFSDTAWDDLEAALVAAWQRGGTDHVRMGYPVVAELGKVLLYSLKTINNFTLTLIFPEDTHVGMIRRQANLMRDAMVNTPEMATLEELLPPLADDELIVEEAEPPAAITQTSRPTGLRAPDGLHEAITAATPPERAKGTYMGYAGAWLLNLAGVNLQKPFEKAINIWLRRVAEEHDWDIHAVDVGEFWVNVHVEVPIKTFIGDVMAAFMAETNARLLETLGLASDQEASIWVEGYSVSTPGRLFEQAEILAFAQYYQDEML